jgi:hypothetical protein
MTALQKPIRQNIPLLGRAKRRTGVEITDYIISFANTSPISGMIFASP